MKTIWEKKAEELRKKLSAEGGQYFSCLNKDFDKAIASALQEAYDKGEKKSFKSKDVWAYREQAIKEAVEKEREACAKVSIREKVDASETGDEGDTSYNHACDHIAQAIRARGNSRSERRGKGR